MQVRVITASGSQIWQLQHASPQIWPITDEQLVPSNRRWAIEYLSSKQYGI